MLDSSAALDFSDAEPFVQSGAVRGASALGIARLDFRRTAANSSSKLPPIVNEADLGQALIDRRPDAMPAAWSRYYPLVHGMLRRALGVDADLDDVVQEVFLCLFKRAPSLRDRHAIRPFIMGIARHMLQRELRLKLRRRRLAVAYAPCSRKWLELSEGAAAGYVASKLSEMLERLTTQERTAFILRFHQGVTVLEIARTLKVSEPTAKRRLHRARQRLLKWAVSDPVLLEYFCGLRISGMADVTA
jgi:RNA polymerase sigma-70 factor, ECF subfamily